MFRDLAERKRKLLFKRKMLQLSVHRADAGEEKRNEINQSDNDAAAKREKYDSDGDAAANAPMEFHKAYNRLENEGEQRGNNEREHEIGDERSDPQGEDNGADNEQYFDEWFIGNGFCHSQSFEKIVSTVWRA